MGTIYHTNLAHTQARVRHMWNAAFAVDGRHDSTVEGAALGFIVATGTWLWIALIDATVGEPFHTFVVLGGVAGFTALHYALNMMYGIAILSVVHAAKRQPSLIIGAIFVFVTLEFAFAMLTILLSHVGLGELAWLRIFGASLFGGIIAFCLLRQRHPLAERLREAEEER